MKRWARKSALWKRSWNTKNRKLDVCMKYYSQRIEDLSQLEENVRNNNTMIEYHSQRIEDLDRLEENIRNNNMIIKYYGQRMEDLNQLEENVRNNNTIIEQLKTLNNKMEERENDYERIDYFEFENRFRGSRAYIKEVQKQYIPYYKGCKNVIDLGSGRGEFLELLKENEIPAIGIEHYREFVELCRKNGLEVIEEDVISYLKRCDKKDGIFAGQLIEHLTIEKVISLCNLSYEKLVDGAYMILETPNPMSLSIYTQSFYIDSSHIKPIHPLTLQYIAEKAGFRKIEILYTSNSKYPVKIPELKGEDIENLEEFNKSMAIVSDTLFGSQDYALIAKK